MKVIFLDIDGVMVTGKHLVHSSKYLGQEFTPKCVENLNQIIEQTGAMIVVSSTWRKGRSRTALQAIMVANGVRGIVLGKTPDHGFNNIRGQEIQEFIDEWPQPISKFVILDDDDDMEELLPRLVQTTWASGLDENSSELAIHLLNSK